MEARKMALDKVYKRRDRYDIPEWQRDEVWSTDRKQLLIDSILSGWKLPKFYFAKTSSNPDEFDVVDGQQRLSAIFEFFSGDLELSDDSAAKFGGRTYDDLPDQVTDLFDDFEIEYDEITEASDHDIQEFFQRLQRGVILTAAEKLNSIKSDLTTFARELAKHDFFTKKVFIKDIRKAYFDISSKVVAVEIDGLDTRLRYEDLKNFFESQESFSTRSNVSQRIRATFDYLDAAFPEKSRVFRSRGAIQSFITLTARLVESGRATSRETKLRLFLEAFSQELSRQVELGTNAADKDYLEFQGTLSANVRAGSRIRHEILLRKLLTFDPSWMDVLGPSAVVASGLDQEIDRTGRTIASLITKKNDDYAAKTGSDLFKATNRTMEALGKIREPVRDYAQYSSFIDSLYFLFREGPGQRLAGAVPPSFEDVNLLRTGLQHDVDHGKEKAASNKRVNIGATFAKYAGGATSPATLAPDRFLIVQAALLSALLRDVENLAV
ncbi:DUF262 domain-containing protein [Nonomuraea sp. NPDC050478]|uniref:DUF262 domain-containing protein n=1 Tax=Nonomuraea sp. NPDC050478 TaxID=3364365 RepID=UPI00378ACAF4